MATNNNQNKIKHSKAKTQRKTQTPSLLCPFLLQSLQGLPFVENKKQQPPQKQPDSFFYPIMTKADYLILWLNGSMFLRYFQFNQIILKLQQFPDDFRCLLSALKVVILQKFMILFSTSFLEKKTTCVFINKHTAQTINHECVMNMLCHGHGLSVLSSMDSTYARLKKTTTKLQGKANCCLI